MHAAVDLYLQAAISALRQGRSRSCHRVDLDHAVRAREEASVGAALRPACAELMTHRTVTHRCSAGYPRATCAGPPRPAPCSFPASAQTVRALRRPYKGTSTRTVNAHIHSQTVKHTRQTANRLCPPKHFSKKDERHAHAAAAFRPGHQRQGRRRVSTSKGCQQQAAGSCCRPSRSLASERPAPHDAATSRSRWARTPRCSPGWRRTAAAPSGASASSFLSDVRSLLPGSADGVTTPRAAPCPSCAGTRPSPLPA